MRTISEAIEHFGKDQIRGKFLLVRINAKRSGPGRVGRGHQIKRVMCYEVINNPRQVHLIAVDADPWGWGIISLGAGTEVVHWINGRKK